MRVPTNHIHSHITSFDAHLQSIKIMHYIIFMKKHPILGATGLLSRQGHLTFPMR
jgi:hypothetical protein